MMQRTIVVGDVHGCIDELQLLAEKVELSDSDQLVFVGDLVAKGPDSRAVVAFAMRHSALAVRGNHEAHLLRWKDEQASLKTRPQHLAVAKSLGEEHWNWLRSLPFLLRLSPKTVVVHGAIDARYSLEEQHPQTMLSGRSIRPDGTVTAKADDGVPWASLWSGPEQIIFGHDAVRGLQQHPYATGLDTGCVYGKQLSAWILPEKRLVQVPAKHTYVCI